MSLAYLGEMGFPNRLACLLLKELFEFLHLFHLLTHMIVI